ncbi:hypothetical protein ElyMa_002351800 [Elysia marginata]|uniref:Ubiquitin-like domain-containing protein n=1 Tax=Elysia marginata TaxID=1093978 RepID=A0AAV4GB39_9GAST|nr:hypothetical protein ElyMa_002351800 [Elysia marginata]
MASIASGFEDDGLPQLGALDQLDKLWKQGVRAAENTSDTTASVSNIAKKVGSQPTSSNMAEPNGVAVTTNTLPQAVDLEATPDLELKIRVVYSDSRVKNLEGSLNPTRLIQQLKARLASQLSMQPHLVEMSWSKKLDSGQQAAAVPLDSTKNLMFYEVETDDTIILVESEEN